MLPKWKNITGYRGLYQVYETGEILSTRNSRVLKPGISSTGYHIVVLTDRNGVRKTHKVHRLVCAAFKRNPKNLPVVAHADDNPLNNHISNLSWASQSKNMKDCHKRGRSKIPLLCGEKSKHAKLTAEDVRIIRMKPVDLICTRQMANFFGVSKTTIKNIINGKTWKHV